MMPASEHPSTYGDVYKYTNAKNLSSRFDKGDVAFIIVAGAMVIL
jgi:hypothetical protein